MREKKLSEKEHQLRKAQLEGEMLEHYEKIIEGMIKWCIYDQPEDLDVMTSVFAVDKRELALKAARRVLKRWENENPS